MILSSLVKNIFKKLEQVLFRLKEANLTVNLSKSHFSKSKGYLFRACSRSWSCDTN